MSATENIFNQLNAIQQLQADIAAEHTKLEALDVDLVREDIHTSPGSPRSPSLSNSRGTAGTARGPGGTGGGPRRASVSQSTGVGDQGQNDEKRAAAEAYDNLAAGLKDRQKGVENIMDKLAQLSKAVKDFHALPPPVLFPDSRVLKSGYPMVDTPIVMSPSQAQNRFG